MPDDLNAAMARLDAALNARNQPAVDAAKTAVASAWHAEVARAGPDAERVIHDPSVPITPQMAEGMLRSGGSAVPVARHLGQNPAEAARISRLSPAQQVVEVARLAERVGRSAPALRPAAAQPREESMESYLSRRNRENAEARRNAHRKM